MTSSKKTFFYLYIFRNKLLPQNQFLAALSGKKKKVTKISKIEI